MHPFCSLLQIKISTQMREKKKFKMNKSLVWQPKIAKLNQVKISPQKLNLGEWRRRVQHIIKSLMPWTLWAGSGYLAGIGPHSRFRFWGMLGPVLTGYWALIRLLTWVLIPYHSVPGFYNRIMT
jgi:hypothetical protein